MSSDPLPGLLPAPTVDEWRTALDATGSVDLLPFSAMELAAVGAGSPLRGLIADGDFLALVDDELDGALGRARQALTGRGLAGAPRPAGEPASTGAGAPVDFDLGGDLAGVVAVRRRPALLALVSAGPAELYRRPGYQSGVGAILAVLHGVAVDGIGLFALLEETRTERGMHLFTLATPAVQAARIFDAWQELESDGPSAVSVQVFVPDPSQPRRTQLVLEAGVARLSNDGATWQRSSPEDGWNALFRSAVAL